MMAQITEWVKTVIFVVLFAAFLELLLPASGMRRFVRVVMGLLILLVMLNPVVEVFQTNFSPDQVPALSGGGPDSASGSAVPETIADAAKQRNQLALAVYEKDLARQIRAVVLALDGVRDAKVDVSVQQSADGRQGAIDKVVVFVMPGVVQSGTDVAPVKITAGGAENKAELKAALKAKVAGTVRELYQLTADQVEIRAMN